MWHLILFLILALIFLAFSSYRFFHPVDKPSGLWIPERERVPEDERLELRFSANITDSSGHVLNSQAFMIPVKNPEQAYRILRQVERGRHSFLRSFYISPAGKIISSMEVGSW